MKDSIGSRKDAETMSYPRHKMRYELMDSFGRTHQLRQRYKLKMALDIFINSVHF